jgi:small subunit ribosomal protein S21
MAAYVKVRHNEDVNRAIRRFKRKVEAEGIMKELKKRKHHMKPSAARREKRKAAQKRRRKNEIRMRSEQQKDR